MSLVFGILSIVFCWLPVVGLLFGVVSIVVSSKNKKKARDGIETAGFICGIIGTVLSSVYLIYWTLFVIVLGTYFSFLTKLFH